MRPGGMNPGRPRCYVLQVGSKRAVKRMTVEMGYVIGEQRMPEGILGSAG